MATDDDDVATIGDILASMKARQESPENAQRGEIAARQSFLHALSFYPIDNRREGECFSDTIREPCIPGARFIHVDPVAATLSHLKANYPRQLAEYGTVKAAQALESRLAQMELNRTGAKKRSGKKTRDWETRED